MPLMPGPAEPARDPLAARDRGDRPRPTAAATARGLVHPVVLIFLLAGVFDIVAGDSPEHWGPLFAVAVVLALDVARGTGDRAAREAAAAGTAPAQAAPGAGGEGTGSGAGAAPRPPPLHGPWRATPALVLGGLAYALVAGGFGRYTWPSTIAVVCPAAASVAIAWRVPVREAARPRRVGPLGLAAWAAVFVAAALWELTSLLLQPSLTTGSPEHPTISVLTGPLLASHPGRSLVLAVWLAGGWFLLRR